MVEMMNTMLQKVWNSLPDSVQVILSLLFVFGVFETIHQVTGLGS